MANVEAAQAQTMSADVIEAARAKMRDKFGGDIGKKIGGKGTARRKVKKVHKSVGGEEKKLSQAVKRLGASDIPKIDEVQLFQEDGQVMSFANPKVQAAPAANTYVVSGPHSMVSEKDVVIRSLIEKLGQNPEVFKKACEDPEFKKQLEAMSRTNGADKDGDADGIPDLTECFDQEEK